MAADRSTAARRYDVPRLMGETYKGDGESWEEYAHRLERRIKEQRDQLESLNTLREGENNRADRKKIERLKRALGNVTENWQREREARIALVRTVSEMEPVVEAATELWEALMDGIADSGDAPVAWDQPYLISAARFSKEHDRLHAALRPFRKVPNDGF